MLDTVTRIIGCMVISFTPSSKDYYVSFSFDMLFELGCH